MAAGKFQVGCMNWMLMATLNRPGAESAVKVIFNWFKPLDRGRQKFSYSVCDPQSIDLDCVISTVSLSVKEAQSKIFHLDPEDANTLDNFVKNKTR